MVLVSYSSESRSDLLSLLNHTRSEHILWALIVDVTISGVQTLRLVETLDSLEEFARMFVDLTLDHIELDKRWRVLNRLVYIVERFCSIADIVEMLRQEVVDPE